MRWAEVSLTCSWQDLRTSGGMVKTFSTEKLDAAAPGFGSQPFQGQR